MNTFIVFIRFIEVCLQYYITNLNYDRTNITKHHFTFPNYSNCRIIIYNLHEKIVDTRQTAQEH
jgi:hypothetical protein